jgi:hypothetical protein
MPAPADLVSARDSAGTADREIWCCPDTRACSLENIEGFLVQASDGALGKVRAAGGKAPGSYLIIAAEGPWTGGRTVMLPAGVVERVDRPARVVAVQCSREQIMNAPRFENDRYQDAAYRKEVGRYYASSACDGAAPAAVAERPA